MILLESIPATAHRNSPLLSALSRVRAELSTVATDVASFARLSDSDLVEASAAVGLEKDALGAIGAMLAGEISRRSAPEFGSQGLAQKHGFRTPTEMVKVVTRTTSRDAVAAVQTGTLLVEATTEGTANPITGEVIEMREPWLKPLVSGVTAGQVSLAAIDAIRAGLGRPDSSVSVDMLTSAATKLEQPARSLDPDGLRRLARAARDEIDAIGVGQRENERREKRSLRLVTLPDGMARLVWLMDPETVASVKDVYDRATSPTLGGVRFVSDELQTQQSELVNDGRTPEPRASDAFAHLLVAGSDADPRVLIGSGAPVVKLIVSLDALERANAARGSAERGSGDMHGFIEGQPDPVSLATIGRSLEIGTGEPVVFDGTGDLIEEHVLASRFGSSWTDLVDGGRTHRLFGRKQKSDLAVRDGGCRWPGCSRPPSWCEAHHVKHWARQRGSTTVENGILLCKHHHLLLHNNRWEIERRRSSRSNGANDYWLIPPIELDPEREPRLMPSKSPAWDALFGSVTGELRVVSGDYASRGGDAHTKNGAVQRECR